MNKLASVSIKKIDFLAVNCFTTLGGANCVGGGNVEGGFKTLEVALVGAAAGGGIDGGFNDWGVYLMVGMCVLLNQRRRGGGPDGGAFTPGC